jgi:hypothetical protein
VGWPPSERAAVEGAAVSGARRWPPRRAAQGRRPNPSTPVWTPPWRKGLPARPKEDPAESGAGSPQPIGTVLDGLFSSKGPWVAGMAGGELGGRWAEVVGDTLDRETAPGSLDEHGVLTVRAASPAWAAQLRFLAVQIGANANDVLGREAVKAVRVVVDRTLTDSRPSTDRRSARGASRAPIEGSQEAGSGP